jgi:hypothetical protein
VYALDVTLGPGGDFQDLTPAIMAVHDAGVDGKVTILDNGFYQGSAAITLPVNIIIEGNAVDPPTLKPHPDCEHPGQTAAGCGGVDDDPLTQINESTYVHAIIHVQGANQLPDPDFVPVPPQTANDNPGLPAVPLDGGSVTFNGVLFESCATGGQTRQCQFVQLGDDHNRHPVQNYTVSFNDCIFEDVESGSTWPNANGTNILLWEAVADTTINFDNCILPWNDNGFRGGCLSSFLTARRTAAAPSSGLDINFNQCSITDESIFSGYHNFIHTRKADTVVTVTNSIIWPKKAKAYGLDFEKYDRFALAFDGQNASACHEFDNPGGADGDSGVANGGAGYLVGDLLTLVGGDQVLLDPGGSPDCTNYANPRPAVFRVTQVNGNAGDPGPGVVSRVIWTGLERRAPDPGETCGGVTPSSVVNGVYAEDGRPTNPVNTSGGTGSGATLNVVWARDLLGMLMTGTISNSVAKTVDPDGIYDWFSQTDQHGVIAIGANVVSDPPMFVKAEGTVGGINRDALDLMDGYELLPGSPAIGRGDAGQDAGYIRPSGPPAEGNFQLAGDCNQDGAVDLSDAVCLLGFLFQNNPAVLPCSTMAGNFELMDCNGDGSIDLSDVIYKLAFLFQGGNAPVQGLGCIDMECPPNPGCP